MTGGAALTALSERERSELDQARHEYEVHGVCCVRAAVSEPWIEGLARGLEQSLAAPTALSRTWSAPDGNGRFFQDVFVWRQVPVLEHFALESGLARSVAAILNTTELRLYSDHVFIRERGTAKETPWHQDESYCFVSGRQFCSIWLPLDPVSRSECLQLVRGSHAWNALYAPVEFASRERYANSSDKGERLPPIDPGRHDIAAWDMQPGDCIMFSARTLHGSPPLPPSRGRRRVYVTRWIGDDARYTEPAWTVPSLPMAPGLSEGERFSGQLFPVAYSSGDVPDFG